MRTHAFFLFCRQCCRTFPCFSWSLVNVLTMVVLIGNYKKKYSHTFPFCQCNKMLDMKSYRFCKYQRINIRRYFTMYLIFNDKITGTWGIDYVSSSPLFSTTPPPFFSKFSYKSFLFQNFHNHSFFLHLTISVDVIHHE